jgi:hypothetical protein
VKLPGVYQGVIEKDAVEISIPLNNPSKFVFGTVKLTGVDCTVWVKYRNPMPDNNPSIENEYIEGSVQSIRCGKKNPIGVNGEILGSDSRQGLLAVKKEGKIVSTNGPIVEVILFNIRDNVP